jgi:hypothetical protein
MATIAATHTVVKSGPVVAPFGAGIFAYVPFAGRMPYTQADLDEVAQMFADAEEDRQYDELAAQREWEGMYEAGLLSPVEFGRCAVCSTPYDDLTPQGLCDACDIHACETSSTNCYR